MYFHIVRGQFARPGAAVCTVPLARSPSLCRLTELIPIIVQEGWMGAEVGGKGGGLGGTPTLPPTGSVCVGGYPYKIGPSRLVHLCLQFGTNLSMSTLYSGCGEPAGKMIIRLRFEPFFLEGGGVGGGCALRRQKPYGVLRGGGVGGGYRTGNESPGPPPFPAHTAPELLTFSTFFLRLPCKVSSFNSLKTRGLCAHDGLFLFFYFFVIH